ncbi:hypothetical protein MFIFM68171_09434 [Madurella fahalii]|uniref:Uncharacterized protein n=1 Tax=Madurella fahalii TaxID=1157608 RepID=A0ABQ0GNA6_9PEZI
MLAITSLATALFALACHGSPAVPSSTKPPPGSPTPSKGPSPLPLFEYHNNSILFLSAVGGNQQYTPQGFFVVSALSITSGQDPEHRNNVGDVHYLEAGMPGAFYFSVGRKGSGEVADYWNSVLRAEQTTFNHDAGRLNFAFFGALNVAVDFPGQPVVAATFEGIGLAQGHTDNGGNNWWFGGKTCTYIGNDEVKCDGTDGEGKPVQWTFWRGGVGDDNNMVQIVSMV